MFAAVLDLRLLVLPELNFFKMHFQIEMYRNHGSDFLIELLILDGFDKESDFSVFILGEYLGEKIINGNFDMFI